MPGHSAVRKLEDCDNSQADGTAMSLDHMAVTAHSVTADTGLGAAAPINTYTQTFATADRTIANATVGADLGAFTDPPSAAEMAALRTFVNALKADGADLRQGVTAVIDDLQTAKIVA